MLVKIKNNDLYSMLKQMATVVLKEKGSFFSEYILIKVMNNNIYCIAINNDIEIITYNNLQYQHNDNEILIKYDLINHICKTHKSEAVLIIKRNYNLLNIIIENTKFCMPILDSKFFPLLRHEEYQIIKFKTKTKSLINSLKLSLIPKLDDTQKHLLTKIFLDINCNKLNIFSSDNLRLIYSYVLIDGNNEKFNLVLSSKIIKEIINVFSNDDDIYIAISNNYITLVSNNTTLICKTLNEKFSYSNALFLKKIIHITSVVTQNIKNIFRRFSILCNKNTKIHLTFSKDKIVFATSVAHNQFVISLNSKSKIDNLVISFYYENFTDILKLINSNKFDIEMSTDYNILIIKEKEKNYVYILTTLNS